MVLDIGPHPTPQPLQGPALIAVPETLELFVVNADGSGLRRVAGPGAGTPTWAPTGSGTSQDTTQPTLLQALLPNGQWKLSWVANPGQFALQSANSINPGAPWADIPGDQVRSEGPAQTYLIMPTEPRGFFRLKKR